MTPSSFWATVPDRARTAPPPSRSDRQAPVGLGLGAWELGGDALGLLQDRVEVFCLDEFVGLQVLEGPGAAYGQAGRGRCPGIGEVDDDEPVVLAEHQVVGLQLAPRGLHRLGYDRDPVTRLLHGPGDGLALEGEEHRILRHRRYPPPADPWDPCIARWLEAMRPPPDRQASTTNRPHCRRGTAPVGDQAGESDRSWLPRSRIGH